MLMPGGACMSQASARGPERPLHRAGRQLPERQSQTMVGAGGESRGEKQDQGQANSPI